MKLLRIFVLLTMASFIFGCGPGGPPPVIEPEGTDPIENVDESVEEGFVAPEEE